MLDEASQTQPMNEQANAEGQTSHSIRITNHGQITNWVAHALDYLEKNVNNSVALHTLPVPKPPAPESATTDTTRSLSTSTTTIPRLISVVEIIKREYLKKLDATHSSVLSGLYQYNEIGCLEDLNAEDGIGSQENAANDLALALEGKNYLKQKRTPYMKVTLSRVPLPKLEESGATFQKPDMRKLSKSAKARAKKREKKENDVVPEHEPEPEIAPA